MYGTYRVRIVIVKYIPDEDDKCMLPYLVRIVMACHLPGE